MMVEILLKETRYFINLFIIIYGITVFTGMKLTYKKYRYILCTIFNVTVIFVSYCYFSTFHVPIGFFSLYLSAIYIFDDSLISKIKYSIFIYLISGVMDIVLSLFEQCILSFYNIDSNTHFIFFVNHFLIFILFTVYKRIRLKKQLKKSIDSNYIGIVCGILIICGGCFDFILQRNKDIFDERLTSFYIICTFAGCIFLMLIFVFFIRAERERIYYMYESQLRGTLMESNAEHYKLTLESYKEFRKQRHDFRGHLIVMQNYVNNKNFDLLETYMSELYENYVLSDNSIHVNNEAADSVLNYFANRARQEDMDFRCEGKFRTEISMSSFQLCTCFYNLLNNAIEACRKIKDGERSILVKIKSFRGTFILIVENTVSEPVDKAYWATGLSSKRDASTHGFGLMNVRAVVEELDGRIIFKNIENRFSIEIILPPAAEENFIHMP